MGGRMAQHRNSPFEILLCAAVIVVAAGFLVHMKMRTGIGSLSSYELTARLPRVDGLDTGSDVRIGGVKIGTVTGLTLEPSSFLADVQMNLRGDIGIPDDSRIVVAQGMMSSPYLEIKPGRSSVRLAPGSSFMPRQGL